MSSAQRSVVAAADVPRYADIEQFYARQIRLLSDGALDRWAETFTPDAVFEQDGRVLPDGARSARLVWHGRTEIAVAAASAVRSRDTTAVVRRYWVGMLTAEVIDAGSVRTGYYGALFNTAGHEVDIFRSTFGTDVLVCGGGQWQVAHRRIDHDDVDRA